MSEYAALVAIDWADKKHAVCLLDQALVLPGISAEERFVAAQVCS
jgi:hypothetical protein